MGLGWPSSMLPYVTQRWGAVALTAEPAGYFDARRALATSFAGATYGAHVHRGLDIRAWEGYALLAAEAGAISGFGTYSNGENWLQVRVNPTTVLSYHHLSRFAGLPVGTKVKRGQVIGYAGSTGNSTAAHLHFEVRISEGGADMRYNPALFLDALAGALVNDPRIAPPGGSTTPGGTDMFAIIDRTPLEAPSPRAWTWAPTPEFPTLNFYDPRRPGMPVYQASWPNGMSGHSAKLVAVDWIGNRPGAPDSGGLFSFLDLANVAVADDVYTREGLIIIAKLVVLEPAVPLAIDPAAAKAAFNQGLAALAAASVGAIGTARENLAR